MIGYAKFGNARQKLKAAFVFPSMLIIRQTQVVKRRRSCGKDRQWGHLKAVFVLCLVAFGFGWVDGLCAADPPPTAAAPNEEVLRREAAIAEFTRKMKEADYPALFTKTADEFGVPADILKGIAFAETRWEHLVWPPGETASPANGMPRPYGIMSLWDNEHFGHSLVDAAKLIGKDPDELKIDPYQNMRGAAALLKKIYGETARPDGTSEQDIESWRYAIAKYCGIPEAELHHRHALEVYEFMNKGYHQYGIEWDAHPVNLGPMREEVKRIVAEENRKREARFSNDPRFMAANGPAPSSEPNVKALENMLKPTTQLAPQSAVAPAVASTSDTDLSVTPGNYRGTKWVVASALGPLCLGGYILYRNKRRKAK